MVKKITDIDKYVLRPALLDWLLDADPSIRWQAMRDLADADPHAVRAERARVASCGWGAALLAFQSPQGHWGGEREDPGLLVTLYSLVLLKDLGLDPESGPSRRMVERVDEHLIFRYWGNRRFFEGEVEPCINGRILGLGVYFKEPNEKLAAQLLGEQLPDGGWNCEAPKSRCSSFHTTICVLEGLLDYQRAAGNSLKIAQARERAENYLLARGLFRSLKTGQIIDPHWLRFAYPPFWHYDILRGLDYLRAAGLEPDERVRDAMQKVLERQHQNGRWPLNHLYREHVPVALETEVGSASRWNTLRALRVLRWFNSARQAAA